MSKSKPLPTIEEVKENTAFKSDTRALAALETLKWLERGAPHKFDGLPGKYSFDMKEFILHNDDNNRKRPDPECGTACCLAGAIRMFERDGKTYKGGSPEMTIDYHFDTFNNESLATLFYARDSDVYLAEITPKGAAKTLRRYIKTGKAKWKKEEQ